MNSTIDNFWFNLSVTVKNVTIFLALASSGSARSLSTALFLAGLLLGVCLVSEAGLFLGGFFCLPFWRVKSSSIPDNSAPLDPSFSSSSPSSSLGTSGLKSCSQGSESSFSFFFFSFLSFFPFSGLLDLGFFSLSFFSGGADSSEEAATLAGNLSELPAAPQDSRF